MSTDPITLDDGGTLLDGHLGGIAFAPGGDVWVTECSGTGPKVHRFDRESTYVHASGTTVHEETTVDLTAAYAPGATGCGIVNHPDGRIFANTPTALWTLDPDTIIPLVEQVNSANAFPGNGRGIAIDPVSLNPLKHVVYVGADCDPNMQPWKTACSVWDFDPETYQTMMFARVTRGASESFDSLYFSPDGSAAFLTYRDTESGATGVAVLARPAAPKYDFEDADDSQILQRVAMGAKPAGVAFNAAGFVVTSNEDGTMTKLSFPGGDVASAPAQSVFASGGFRGDLVQVGADACLYAVQGRQLAAGGTTGVRFNDGSTGSSDSVVRICGGFVAAPGASAGGPWSAEPGSISGSAFQDFNRNGVQDAGEPGLGGVTLSLSGAASASVPTAANGSFTFTSVASGLYSVSAPAAVNGLSGTPTPAGVDLGPGENRLGVNFPYSESALPVCTAAVQAGSPARITASVSDALSGLRSIQLTALDNVQVAVGSNAPVSAPATVSYGTPAAGNVAVTATRVNASQPASFTLRATDAFGNVLTCASPVVPADAPPLPPPPPSSQSVTRVLLDRGWGDVDVVRNVPTSLHYVRIVNRAPGLRSVSLLVNHKWFHFTNLKNGQVVTVDIATALRPRRNHVVLAGWGQRSGSAEVTLSSRK